MFLLSFFVILIIYKYIFKKVLALNFNASSEILCKPFRQVFFEKSSKQFDSLTTLKMFYRIVKLLVLLLSPRRLLYTSYQLFIALIELMPPKAVSL